MKETILYDLLCMYKLDHWLENEQNKVTAFSKEIEKMKNNLHEKIDNNTKEILDRYVDAIKANVCNIYYNLNIKTLRLGIKIGTEIGDSPLD